MDRAGGKLVLRITSKPDFAAVPDPFCLVQFSIWPSLVRFGPSGQRTSQIVINKIQRKAKVTNEK